MNKLSVVILEPSEEHHPQLSEYYKKFFSTSGYTAEITCVCNEEKLINKLETTIVDVVISDLFLKSQDFAGLIVVQSVKTDFPDVFCIGNSGRDVGYRDTTSKLPTFDMFIDKGGLIGNRKYYIDVMIKEFLAKFKRNTDICIDSNSKLPDELKNNNELHSLLSQVTFVSHKQDTHINGRNILLTPLSGGKSGSHVFKMIAKNPKSNISSVPAVLKISKRRYAEEELENYNRFVKWILPYSWRVDLLGVGFTKSYGAVCHSFVLSGREEFDSLTHFISHGKVDIVKNVLAKIFNPDTRSWYADELILCENNINERYLNKYFKKDSAKDTSSQKFAIYCQEVFHGSVVTKTYVEVFGHRYLPPMDCLFGQPNGKYQSCICHGDMNSNNIIVAKNGEIIFIDFQHTGRGHVFEDFIAMEASIRLFFCNSVDNRKKVQWEDVFEWEEIITSVSSNTTLPQSYQIIADIRSHAKDNFPKENFRNYYYGVAAINCRLLRIPNISDEQKGYLLSGILKALDKLEKSN